MEILTVLSSERLSLTHTHLSLTGLSVFHCKLRSEHSLVLSDLDMEPGHLDSRHLDSQNVGLSSSVLLLLLLLVHVFTSPFSANLSLHKHLRNKV